MAEVFVRESGDFFQAVGYGRRRLRCLLGGVVIFFRVEFVVVGDLNEGVVVIY